NTIQAEEMSWLSNDPQNRKMYLMTSRSKMTNKSRMTSSGGLQIPDNSVKLNNSSFGKNVTNFCINCAVRKMYYAGDRSYSDTVIIDCENVYCERFTVIIKHGDFINYHIKSEFEKQSNNAIFSADIKASRMNGLLFNYIKSVMKEKRIEIADKPGFYLKNESYNFIAHKDGNEEYETDTVKQAKFETAEISQNDIDCQVIRSAIQNHRILNMLMILDISSFMYTLLKDNGHTFNKIVAVTGCDTKEKKQMLRNFFKVYERECDTDISLDVKLKELRNIVFSRKDEMIILEDDVSTKNRLAENMRFLYNCFVRRRTDEGEIAECNCMIICSKAQTVSVFEEYSDDIIWIDVSDICELKDCFGAVVRLKHRIRNAVIQIAETKKLLPMFFDTSEYTSECEEDSLPSTLHMIETVCDKMLKTGIDIGLQSEKIIADISWYLRNSELFYDENHITEQFGIVLSKAIEQGKIAFGNIDSTENLPIYVKGDLLLTSVNDFARLEQMIPFGLIDRTPKSNGIRLRSILREKGYLVTNNGDKLLYKASVSENSSDRMNFVALKKNLLTAEAKKIVPVIRKKAVSTLGYQPPDNNDSMDRILLGTTLDTELPVYWSIGNSKLLNQHLYIQADSGSGKTTLLFLLAQRLYKAGKNVLILDFAETESYSEYKIFYMNDRFIKNTGHSVFENGVSENNIRHCYFQSYISETNDSCINIIRCTPVEAVNILKNIFNNLNNNNHSRENDVYVILDEINSLNFDKKFSENNDQTVADIIFRQGRSIGLNLISATQFLSNKGSKSKAQLFNQSATKIALHMNSSSSTAVAKSISVSRYSYYKEVLEKMTVGQAIMYSGVECSDNNITNDMPLQIKISSLNK
ncbi:MAG: DUF87 domain-containing protein, partial [Muribaculaceae bacterium]|nr:DUF87 domain-containing protein [Muribaculaceae bacterium]